MEWKELTDDVRAHIRGMNPRIGMFFFYDESNDSYSTYSVTDATHYLTLPAIEKKPKSMTNQEIKEVLDAVESGRITEVYANNRWQDCYLLRQVFPKSEQRVTALEHIAQGEIFRVKKSLIFKPKLKYKEEINIKSEFDSDGLRVRFPYEFLFGAGDKVHITLTGNGFGHTSTASVERASK